MAIKVKTHRHCDNPNCDEYSKESGKQFKKQNSLQKYCSYPCQVAVKGVDLKLKKPINKVSKTNKLIPKEKTLSVYKANLQKEINYIVRELDKGHNCICGNKPMKMMTAGHFIGIGANETLRFHLLNIWGQDFASNGSKGGEPIEFKEGLRRLYGNEFLDRIEALKSIKSINLTIDEIIIKISVCRGILKWLKLQDREFSIQERVALREAFNTEIGIYGKPKE